MPMLTMHENTMLYIMVVWQSSRPANFSPAGLTLWPNRLERWLATLSVLSNPGSNTSGLAGHYIGGSSAGLGEAQRVDNSLRADWLSCFSLAWWEWRVARQGCLVPLRKGGMWQSSRPASFSPAGLTLWLNRLKRWLATLSVLSNPGSNTSGLAGHYSSKVSFLSFPQTWGHMQSVIFALMGMYFKMSMKPFTLVITPVSPKRLYVATLYSTVLGQFQHIVSGLGSPSPGDVMWFVHKILF